MLSKQTMALISFCLAVTPAAAQTALNASDRQAVIDDQRALDEAYRQLDLDRQQNNAAGIQIDQDRVTTMEQTFKTDEDRIMADDEQALAADKAALDKANLQLQRDLAANSSGVAADRLNIGQITQKLEADKRQSIADDGLEVARSQQALDNANQKLEMDLRSNSLNPYSYEYGSAYNGNNMITADQDNLRATSRQLQNAQMKLQMDRQ